MRVSGPEAPPTTGHSHMIIQCPQCKTQARLSDSQEGAKVRCSECERVYTAAPFGARGSRTKNNTLPIYLAAGGGLVVVLIIVMMNSGTKEIITPVTIDPIKEVAAKEPVDYEGWESAPVRAVRDIHRAALAYNETKLKQLLDAEHTWLRVQADATEAAAEQAEKELAEGEEAIMPDTRSWSDLTQGERAEFIASVIKDLTSGAGKELVADWKPYNGKVVDETDFECTVEVSVQPSGPSDSTAQRTILWKLIREGKSKYRAFSWERFYNPSELAELARQKRKTIQKKTLVDGSIVIEGEPRIVEHYEDTSAEVRDQIDLLFATLIDHELSGPENGRAGTALVEIGKPAIPALLTGLYQIPLKSIEQAIQLNQINQVLSDITGHYTTYNPMRHLDGDAALIDELNLSGIKQWFGWFATKGRRFIVNTEEDLIDTELQPRNEKERREYERELKRLKDKNN